MEDILDLSGGIRVYIREWLDSKIYLPSIFFRKVYYPSDIVGPPGSGLNQWKLVRQASRLKQASWYFKTTKQ